MSYEYEEEACGLYSSPNEEGQYVFQFSGWKLKYLYVGLPRCDGFFFAQPEFIIHKT